MKMKEKDIAVLIIEDEPLFKNLVREYFEKGRVTYAALFKESQRKDVTDALDSVKAR